MGSSEISPDIESLLRRSIDSYEQLGALLLLRRQADRMLSAESAATALKVTVDVAEETLDHLCRQGLLRERVDGAGRTYQYAPLTPGLGATVDALAAAYDEDLLAVMSIMNKNAVERVRTEAARTFADAFILGGKKDKDG